MKISILLLIFCLADSSHADDTVAIAADYGKQAMTEVAAAPPLLLLKNEKGKTRHEAAAGYITLDTDDDSNLLGGGKADEKGDSSGFGIGYGYQNAWKDRWAYYIWFQAATVDGSHTQSVAGTTTGKSEQMDSLGVNLAFGVSYEFLRDKDNHTLNVFGGPSLMYMDFHVDGTSFNTSGTQTNFVEAEWSGLLPGVTAGLMYEYRLFETFQIVPYGIISYPIVDRCQEVDTVQGQINGSSPDCGGANKVDIAPEFASIGVKFNYIPWDLGFNISGAIRNAILREDKDDRPQVKGLFISLSKSWGNG